ncbi:MAG: ABC transporter permease, partial [Eubacteriales bacterium]|nr:ABC transporter permease [Eubacteriales bacterium]
MQLFKAYLKIIKKNIPVLMIYLLICIILTIMMTVFNRDTASEGFQSTKIRMALIVESVNESPGDLEGDINGDSVREAGASAGAAGQDIAEGLREYLGNYAVMVELPDDRAKIKDALFYRDVSYVLRIPADFDEKFTGAIEDYRQAENSEGTLSGIKEIISLERTVAAADSAAAVYADMLTNRYLDMVRLYLVGTEWLTIADAVALAAKALSISTPVEMEVPPDPKPGNSYNIAYFFNYLAYALFSILILGVTTCMFAFNNIDIKRRNMCSPLPLRQMYLQMAGGNLVFAVLSWAVMILAGLAIFGKQILSQRGMLLCVNSFIFMTAGLSISYLISGLLKSRNAQGAVANVVTLGTCFIAGVFVPQEFLGDFVLTIARFTPTYWYVRANNLIVDISDFSGSSTGVIISCMLIQAGFAAGILLLSLFI